jgi:hypothetical protein
MRRRRRQEHEARDNASPFTLWNSTLTHFLNVRIPWWILFLKTRNPIAQGKRASYPLSDGRSTHMAQLHPLFVLSVPMALHVGGGPHTISPHSAPDCWVVARATYSNKQTQKLQGQTTRQSDHCVCAQRASLKRGTFPCSYCIFCRFAWSMSRDAKRAYEIRGCARCVEERHEQSVYNFKHESHDPDLANAQTSSALREGYHHS